MTTGQLQELVRLRIGQARETIREAEVLLQASAPRGVVNRSYYAMFYATLALLATKQLGPSKHSGVIGLFDREFVKPGLLAQDLSRSLHLAFDRRQTHDYHETVPLSLAVAVEALADARDFVDAVERYLGSLGYQVTAAVAQ